MRNSNIAIHLDRHIRINMNGNICEISAVKVAEMLDMDLISVSQFWSSDVDWLTPDLLEDAVSFYASRYNEEAMDLYALLMKSGARSFIYKLAGVDYVLSPSQYHRPLNSDEYFAVDEVAAVNGDDFVFSESLLRDTGVPVIGENRGSGKYICKYHRSAFLACFGYEGVVVPNMRRGIMDYKYPNI